MSFQAQYQTQKPSTQQIVSAAADRLLDALRQGRSEAMADYLRVMGRFHRYSLNNVLLIAQQRPAASQVCGFKTWLSLGRHVRKGEKGIKILAPIVGKKKADEDQTEDGRKERTQVYGFRTVFVFDRLSRDLRPCTACQHAPPRGGASGVLLNGSSHIIAQFTGALQGGLNANEFQFAGGDLSGWFVVSLCCV